MYLLQWLLTRCLALLLLLLLFLLGVQALPTHGRAKLVL